MNTSWHFILQLDIKPPYDKIYRSAANKLSDNNSDLSKSSTSFTIFLCDTDEAIWQHKSEGLPVIAVAHEGNTAEELMGTPWLILSPEALTPEFLYEVYCRHYCLPMWILETKHCQLRELSQKDCGALLLLQEENEPLLDGCFFPANCDRPEEFLSDYIRHQYPFFGFGLYAILQKESGNFMGIAGFARFTEDTPGKNSPDNCCTCETNHSEKDALLSAEVSYALLQKYQHRGFAEEILRELLTYGKNIGEFEQFTARIRPENTASVALARKCGITIYYK